MAQPKFEANEKPIDKMTLDELIKFSGHKADMILQYNEENEKGYFLIFVKYGSPCIVRQLYTQRKKARRFFDLKRAINWGKKVGFNSVSLNIKYSEYSDSDSDSE